MAFSAIPINSWEDSEAFSLEQAFDSANRFNRWLILDEDILLSNR
jgi:hypothetical protein